MAVLGYRRSEVIGRPAPVHVLVVDGSPINLEVARRILELEGAQVRLANGGQQAVDWLPSNPQSVAVWC